MNYQQFRDLAPVYALFTMPFVLAKKSGRNSVCTAEPALTINAIWSSK